LQYASIKGYAGGGIAFERDDAIILHGCSVMGMIGLVVMQGELSEMAALFVFSIYSIPPNTQ
jgi:hypothetical protein